MSIVVFAGEFKGLEDSLSFYWVETLCGSIGWLLFCLTYWRSSTSVRRFFLYICVIDYGAHHLTLSIVWLIAAVNSPYPDGPSVYLTLSIMQMASVVFLIWSKCLDR